MCDEDYLPLLLHNSINVFDVNISIWSESYRVRYFSSTGKSTKHIERMVTNSILRGRTPKIDNVRIIPEG